MLPKAGCNNLKLVETYDGSARFGVIGGVRVRNLIILGGVNDFANQARLFALGCLRF